MLLLVLFISLFTKGAVQEFGDIQQLLGFAFGHRLSAMMSSCCIVRELQCPPLRRQRVTSYQNLSSDITSGLERFSRCVCSNHRRCVLSFPANFLPDAADGVSYDVTFVTVSTTAQYTCLYNGTRALVCQGRQSMRTGMLGWVLPNFAGGGGYGMMGALGSAGLLGEEMEEAMEQMVESGLPPPRPSRPPCRRCAPLRCAVAVGRETARLRAYRLRQIGTAQRQLYHRCLRHHGIRPPQSMTATTTTARPPIRLPMTPPTDSEPDHTTFLPTTTTATTTTTRKTTTTTTRRTTTSTTTTTRKPTTKGTTPKLPVIVTTPKIDVPKHQPTTPETPTTKAFPAAATTSEAYVTTFTPKVSTTTPATTSTPQVITRILVGSGTETTSTAPRQKAVADVTESGGGGTSIGGSGVAGVVIGVSAAMAVMAAALFFLLLRRRRRKKQTEELSGSVVAVGKLSAGHGGKHHKARPLPSVSSKKAVIDAEDADEDFEKADDDDDDDDDEDSANDGTPAGEEERYTLPPYSQSASAAHRKPRLSTRSSKAGDDESLYASLDESAIDPSLPAHPVVRAAVNVVGSGVGSESLASGDPPSKAAARKESKTFYNAEGLVPPLGGGDSRAAASQAVGGRRRGSYYNLKPGSAPPAARSLGLQDHVTAADGSGNANYVNAPTSLSKNPYEKPRSQGAKHMYTSLKVGNAAPGDAASPQRGDTTNATTAAASGDDPQSAAVTSRAPRSDIYSQPYGSISRNNGRHSAVAGRESSRVGRTTSSSSSSIVSAAVCIPDRSGNSAAKQDSEASAPSGGRVAARKTPAERESGNTSAATKRDSERSGLAGRESANSLVRTRESTHTPAGPKRDWERSANNNNNNSATPSSARTPVSRQGSNPAAACRTGPPRVDHDGYLLPVTPRRQQRL